MTSAPIARNLDNTVIRTCIIGRSQIDTLLGLIFRLNSGNDHSSGNRLTCVGVVCDCIK